jgi:hypothetical protein
VSTDKQLPMFRKTVMTSSSGFKISRSTRPTIEHHMPEYLHLRLYNFFILGKLTAWQALGKSAGQEIPKQIMVNVLKTAT